MRTGRLFPMGMVGGRKVAMIRFESGAAHPLHLADHPSLT